MKQLSLIKRINNLTHTIKHKESPTRHAHARATSADSIPARSFVAIRLNYATSEGNIFQQSPVGGGNTCHFTPHYEVGSSQFCV